LAVSFDIPCSLTKRDPSITGTDNSYNIITHASENISRLMSRRENTNPSEHVIEQVADEKGVSTLDLSPLFEVIEPDALDALFHSHSAAGEQTGYVQFEYEGHTVVVNSTGRVSVAETSE
jgi:hypothetical protein